MNIYVDADACPVKELIIQEAQITHTPVTLVTSFAHFSQSTGQQGVETIYVDTGPDAADYRIMQLAQKNDIVITQDYGLASLALAKGCIVLHHVGFQYTNENIEQMLETRYLNAKIRKSGKRTKGPKPYTEADRERFRSLLKQFLRQPNM